MNIVIADDEQIIVKWLQKNIEELSPDYHVVAVCKNGKQVLNCCLDQQVDVLFTDIRMPIMDGLELLEILRANNALPYTIVLSAYDDFSYARDAFRRGANEYLLKPEITKENLRQCLVTVSRRIEKEKTDVTIEPLENSLQSFLDRFITDQESVPESEQNQYAHDFTNIYKNGFIVMDVISRGKTFNAVQTRDVIDVLFQEEKLSYHLVFKGEKELVIVCGPSHGEGFFTDLKECLSSFGMPDVAVNISTFGCEFSELESLYCQVNELAQIQHFYGETKVLEYTFITGYQKNVQQLVDAACKEMLSGLDSESADQIIKRAEGIIELAQKRMLSVAFLKQQLMDLLMSIHWEHMSPEQRREYTPPQFLLLSGIENIDELRNIFLNRIVEMVKILKEKHFGQNYSEPVRKALAYINENYTYDIRLDDLSEHAHLNRSYLSTRFKKEVGVNINVYLLNCRLEKAKQLLCETNDQVQEICNKVGISDSAYFSKQFRRYTGENPLAYRRIHK